MILRNVDGRWVTKHVLHAFLTNTTKETVIGSTKLENISDLFIDYIFMDYYLIRREKKIYPDYVLKPFWAHIPDALSFSYET